MRSLLADYCFRKSFAVVVIQAVTIMSAALAVSHKQVGMQLPLVLVLIVVAAELVLVVSSRKD